MVFTDGEACTTASTEVKAPWLERIPNPKRGPPWESNCATPRRFCAALERTGNTKEVCPFPATLTGGSEEIVWPPWPRKLNETGTFWAEPEAASATPVARPAPLSNGNIKCWLPAASHGTAASCPAV